MRPRMRGRTAGRSAAALLAAGVLLASVPAGARSTSDKSAWVPVDRDTWYVGGGGDAFRTGFNPTESRPKFTSCAPTDDACHDSKGPWLEWVTKISDLPSGAWIEGSMLVDKGLVFVNGGATNSFLALDQDTGLPVWRFSPDPRVDGHSGNYPGSNAAVIANGRVFVTFSSGYVVGLDELTGRKLWSYRATDGYKDTDPDRVGTSAADAPATSPYRSESFLRNRSAFGPVHPGVDYPKPHGASSYCENTFIFMTLSGWVYGINATTGSLRWKTYADAEEFPGELVWPEFATGGVQKAPNKAAGMSTRRFEAVPGVGCLHGEVQVAGSDGHVRFLDPATGKTATAGADVGPEVTRVYGAENQCVDAGFNCDIAVGFADPTSGDYVLTTLDSRVLRIDWLTHNSEWLRDYNAPLPFESGGAFALPPIPETEDGLITQAVTGGPMAIDPESRYFYFANQDGHLYVASLPEEGAGDEEQGAACAPGATTIRPEGASPAAASPCLVARVGMNPNADRATEYSRKDKGGPWDYDQHALNGVVLGGDVLYVSTWDNTMNAWDVADPASPRKIWEHEIVWNDDYRYPPFGDTFDSPFADIDLKVFSGSAIVGGHLYFAANDGSVYSFNLHRRVKARRNLAILGSGTVPFLPEIEGKIGTYDRVWTPADWYKNQTGPAGYSLPRSAGMASAATLVLGAAAMWWYVRRRDDLMDAVEREAPR